jgi:Uma2 family endonuclease
MSVIGVEQVVVYLDVDIPKTKRGQPTWETALFYPLQGEWTEDDYFAIEGSDNRLKELDNGYLEILTMPSAQHQRLLKYLLLLLERYLRGKRVGGEVLFAPLPVRLWPGTVREPDLVYLNEARSRRTDRYPDGADLVMEIVSDTPEDRKRDLVTKRRQYAKAGISEYWIIDPKHSTIAVFELDGRTKKYRKPVISKSGHVAVSKLFPGFSVDVAKLFTRASRS